MGRKSIDRLLSKSRTISLDPNIKKLSSELSRYLIPLEQRLLKLEAKKRGKR